MFVKKANVSSRCSHYFPAAILVHIWCAPTWRFHTELCKFLRNISANIYGLGKRTDLKLGEVPSLFISNKITISWLYPLNGFRLIFFVAWQWKRSILQLLQFVGTCFGAVTPYNITIVKVRCTKTKLIIKTMGVNIMTLLIIDYR